MIGTPGWVRLVGWTTGVAGAVVLATWPFVGEAGRVAVCWGATVALATQLVLHLLLAGWRRRDDRFVAATAIGFAGRAVVVVGAAFSSLPVEAVPPVPFLLSLGGLLAGFSVLDAALEYRRSTARRPEAAPA